LKRELDEAREQQAATAEILRVISSSPTNLQRVFADIAASAARLCDAYDATIFQVDGDFLRIVAHHGPIPGFPVGDNSLPLIREVATGRAVLDQRTIHVADLLAETAEYPASSDAARRLGFRTLLAVPLIRAGEVTGAATLRRTEARLFSEKQIALLEIFANQAVIAIENSRLFEAEQMSKRELQEALEYQTATSEVLNVISRSPTNAQPVFDSIATSAAQLCGAVYSNVQVYDGELLHWVGDHNLPAEVKNQFQRLYPRRPDRAQLSGRAIIQRETIHVHDLLQDPEYPRQVALTGSAGVRSNVRDRREPPHHGQRLLPGQGRRPPHG
jgi:two-component system, NtrC family, sensor kinase